MNQIFRIIRFIAKKLYYYEGVGIGTGTLNSRYSLYNPINQGTLGLFNGYYYLKTIDNKLTVPPFSYSWTDSQYLLKARFPTQTISENGFYTIPFDKIEYGGDSSLPFDVNANWTVIDINSYQYMEKLRNSYLRIKRSDMLDVIVANNYVNNNYIEFLFDYKESWGNGIFPTGITYEKVETVGWL